MIVLSPVARPQQKNIRFSSSLETGLYILGIFCDGNRVLGVADVASLVNIPRGTTHRYLSTLVRCGQLEQTANRKYRRVSLDG
jgi:DNA-binding IclR family transcriptional regulator